MTTLIIGGSSGLGLELARLLSQQGKVIITGRTDPGVDFAEFHKLGLTGQDLSRRITKFVEGLPEIDLFIYSAGFYQGRSLTELIDEQIESMLDVGARGLIYSTRAVLKKQGKLDEVITITSSSQYTPRALETVYNFVKSGEALFSNALTEGDRVGKVLVAAPGGMQTSFWRDDPGKDVSDYLDPVWVAEEIQKARQDKYRYKEIRILRGNPPTVERVEIR